MGCAISTPVETRLYYLQSRYYDPEVGRWISSDTIEMAMIQSKMINGLNLYSYCMNNPVNYSDTTGHSILLSIFIGILISVAAEGFADIIDDGKFNRGWQDYLGAAVAGAIGGLGVGLISTMVFSGVGDVVGGLINGSITNFGQALGVFALSAAVAGVSFGIAKGIQRGMTNNKYHKIIGQSSENIKINKKLAHAGIKGVKIGRDGIDAVLGSISQKSYWFVDDIFEQGFNFVYGTANSAWG